MLRTAIARNARLFSTTVRSQKSVTESVKDAAKAVDRTIADAALKGLEKGGTCQAAFQTGHGCHLKKLETRVTAAAGSNSDQCCFLALVLAIAIA